jgi:sugar lactone lactonase YvrE
MKASLRNGLLVFLVVQLAWCGFSQGRGGAAKLAPGVYTGAISANLPFIDFPGGIAVDAAGGIYVTSRTRNQLYRISPDGSMNLVAGTGAIGFSGDGGPATLAKIFEPTGIVIDSAGNLFISDEHNNRIRKITPDGTISTVAGNATSAKPDTRSRDGDSAIDAPLLSPSVGAVDSKGNLYIVESGSQRIRKVTPEGIISTFAGKANPRLSRPGGLVADGGFSGDGGPATEAELNMPSGITFDTAGNFYIADSGNNRIRKITPDGIINTFAGNGTRGSGGDGGKAIDAQIVASSMVFDVAGNFYIAEAGNHRIRKITPDGRISTFGGSGFQGSSSDGIQATRTSLSYPRNLTIDAAGNLYFLEGMTKQRVRKISPEGILSSVTGSESASSQMGMLPNQSGGSTPGMQPGNRGTPPGAGRGSRGNPLGGVPANGDLMPGFPAVGSITGGRGTPPGVITGGRGTITQGIPPGMANISPQAPSSQSATNQAVAGPYGISVDDAGGFYVSSPLHHKIYRATVDPSTRSLVLSVKAGGGTANLGGGAMAATDVQLKSPSGIAVDSAGNLYFADSEANRVFKVVTNGMISIVAGNGSRGFAGDGGQANDAQLNAPAGVTVDAAGNVYFADSGNNRIRKVSPNGAISTFAGAGFSGFGGDGGKAIDALLNYPTGLALDISGNLYVADSKNNRIRRISAEGIIGSVAGNGAQGNDGDGKKAVTALLNYPAGVAVDASGNFYISDSGNNRVRKVSAEGIISVVAGTTNPGAYNADGRPINTPNAPVRAIDRVITGRWGDGGPATEALLSQPSGIALNSSGTLYIADSGNNRVRSVGGPRNMILTVAGNGQREEYYQVVLATAQMVGAPYAVVPDGAGGLYVSSPPQHTVYRVAADGTLSTKVGGYSSNGSGGRGAPAAAAQFSTPSGLAVDSAGTLCFADSEGNRVYKVTTNGAISLIAGKGESGYSGDGGMATAANLSYPTGLALDRAGNLFIADSGNNRIRKITPEGAISTVAGNGTAGGTGDGGKAIAAQLNYPSGVAIDDSGNLYIADSGSHRIRKVTPTGIISTIAGNGVQGGGSLLATIATSMSLNYPQGVAVDSEGVVYIADSGNDFIFKLTADGILRRVIMARKPSGLFIDTAGNMFIADTGDNRVRKLMPNGTASTVAGNGSRPVVASIGKPPMPATSGITNRPGDRGVVTAEQRNRVTGVAVDSAGNLYVAVAGSSQIRKITTAGVISTVAGNGSRGFSGDGGPATAAQLDFPTFMTVDPGGNLYFLDSVGQRIRKVTAQGIISTVAGTGVIGFSGDGGPATAAQFHFPRGLAIDSEGNLYTADSQNNRIRKITPGGIISTVAGSGIRGYAGDGKAAIEAQLNRPQGVVFDSRGNLYFADAGNACIRKVTPKGIISTLVRGDSELIARDVIGSIQLKKLGTVIAMAIDAKGNIYAADAIRSLVQKITPNGSIETVMDDMGNVGNLGIALRSYTPSREGGYYPAVPIKKPVSLTDIAVDAAGNVYIVDSTMDQIRKVTPSGLVKIMIGN